MSNPRGIIYIVDDDEQARRGVRALLETLDAEVADFESAESFLESYDGRRPACLVTDVRMLGMSGIELQEHLKQMGITISVVVITAHATTPLTVKAIRNGAFTLLEKPCDEDALWNAARRGLQVDAEVYQDELRKQALRDRLASLTEKERCVLDGVVAGEANKVIARKMDVSIRTVENHRSRVFDKMQADSVAELVRLTLDLQ
ncbi:MAG: response regulator [Lacipirellulaceae bacterium]